MASPSKIVSAYGDDFRIPASVSATDVGVANCDWRSALAVFTTPGPEKSSRFGQEYVNYRR